MAIVTAKNTETFSLDAFSKLTLVVDGECHLTINSRAEVLKSDFEITKGRTRAYGPFGIPTIITLEVTEGSVQYTAAPTLIANDIVFDKAAGLGSKIDLEDPTFGWRDIIGKVIPKSVGAGSPVRSVYMGGQLGQYAFMANDAYDMEFHIPHDYVPGTDIYIHLHWSHNGTSISGNAVFDIYHSYAKGHNQGNFAAEKNLTITYVTTDIATTPQYRHRIDEVVMSGPSATATLMDRDDIEPDGLILMTVKLTTLPTIGGAGKLFVHTADIHYQSTNIGTKQKTPSFYT